MWLLPVSCGMTVSWDSLSVRIGQKEGNHPPHTAHSLHAVTVADAYNDDLAFAFCVYFFALFIITSLRYSDNTTAMTNIYIMFPMWQALLWIPQKYQYEHPYSLDPWAVGTIVSNNLQIWAEAPRRHVTWCSKQAAEAGQTRAPECPSASIFIPSLLYPDLPPQFYFYFTKQHWKWQRQWQMKLSAWMLPLSLADDMPDCGLAPPRGQLDHLPRLIMRAPSSSQLDVYKMHKSQMSDIGEAAFEKSVDTLNCAWRCLENAIILAAKVFKKITSFWYCCVFSWLYWENQWNERQEIGWVKSTYDLFQRTLKSKYY